MGLASFDLLAKPMMANCSAQMNRLLGEEYKSAFKRFARWLMRKVLLLIDAEETLVQKPIDELTPLNAMQQFNKERALIFYTFQMYCHAMFANLKKLHQHAKDNGYILGAKLVRGAYMERERARAQEMDYTRTQFNLQKILRIQISMLP